MILDGLRSLISSLGDPGRDKAAGLRHVDAIVADDQLIAAYRSDWISKKVVDIPADDALRKWRTWGGEARNALVREEERLGLQAKTSEALIQARLLGGAAIYFGVAGQDPAEPLEIDRVGQGQLEYLTVLTRRELTAGDIGRDPFSPYYGRPEMYEVSGNVARAQIHPSRLALFSGDPRADRGVGANLGWDESVLIAVDTIVKQTLGTFANTSSLVHEANIDVVSIPDLAMTAASPAGEQNLLRRFQLVALSKSINGMMLLDKEEDYQRRSASFANLPELMEAFARFCAAAADIPATRFLAQSPSGLIATGESDMDNYHDKIGAIQSLEIRPALRNLDACMARSALGTVPEDLDYDWTPLQQLNELELATLGKTICEQIKMLAELHGGGAFSAQEIRELAVHKLAESGAMPHIETVVEATREALSLDDPDELGT